MSEFRTISDKVKEFLALSGIKKPDAKQAENFATLRGELSAIGLDPQHTNGLAYRALVYDHKTMIENYLKLREAKKDTHGTGYRLKKLGININNTKQLHIILDSFKVGAKDADRQKGYDHVKPAHKAREDYDAAVQDEIKAEKLEKAAEVNAEAIQTAVQLCEESEEAKATRELMCDESFNAWLSNVFTSAVDTVTATT